MSRSTADKRDVYYRLCKSEGYRARSAYKLLHLDEEYDLFRGVTTACDLCAAPGSWSQVLSRQLQSVPRRSPNGQRPKIVSVDLQPMAPLANVTTLCGDITLPSTVKMMLEAMEGKKAELVICDGAPEVTGVHDLDAYLHAQLLLAAFTLAIHLMAPQATLIFKIFTSPMDPDASLLVSQMRPFFESPSERNATAGAGCDAYGRRGGVWVSKPRSSRAGSAEAFLVCRNFNPAVVPSSLTVSSLNETSSLSLTSFEEVEPFVEVEDSPEASRWRALTAYTVGDLDA